MCIQNCNSTGLDDEIDIQRTTHIIRYFRYGLVYTEAQYELIYTALNHHVQSMCTRITAEKVSSNSYKKS